MDLREKDRDTIFDKLGKGDPSAAPTVKRKSENDDEGSFRQRWVVKVFFARPYILYIGLLAPWKNNQK
jgi:hypothetical protein